MDQQDRPSGAPETVSDVKQNPVRSSPVFEAMVVLKQNVWLFN